MRLLVSLVMAFALLLAACGGESGQAGVGGNVDTNSQTACDPAVVCNDLECGQPEGCDVDCGTCVPGSCEAGACVCQPQCDGRACGPDGCGGTCGACSGADVCNEMSGVCDATCTPVTCDEMGFECSEASDGCGGTISCGTCAVGGCAENLCTNTLPTFEWVGLDSERFVTGPDLALEWRDEDPEQDASISIYWDTDAAGADGTLLLDGISEDDAADTAEVDLSRVPRGPVWLYATIDDGSGPVVVYANAPLRKTTPECEDYVDNFTIDVESVQATIELTLNGNPVSPFNTSEDDFALLSLRDPDQGVTLELGYTWDWVNEITVGEFTANVLPGNYELVLKQEGVPGFGGEWPDGQGTVTTAITIDADGTYAFDIVSRSAQIDVAIDGQRFTSTNFPTDWPQFRLLSESGYRVNLPPATFGSASYPITVALPAEDFAFRYDNFVGGVGVPLTSSRFENFAPAAESGPFTIDIAAVDQEFTVLVNGVDAADPLRSDMGTLYLVPAGQSFSLGTRIDVYVADLPKTVSIIPGRYDIYYESFQILGVLPQGFTLAAEDVLLDGSAMEEISVDGVDTTVTVTLDGAPISASNTDEGTRSFLTIRQDPLFSGVVLGGFYDYGSQTATGVLEAFLVPGEYELSLTTSVELEPSDPWPRVERVPIGALNPTVEPNPTIDIKTARVLFPMTLDGQSVSGSNTGELAGSASFDLLAGGRSGRTSSIGSNYVTYVNGTSSVVNPLDVRTIQGSYTLTYNGTRLLGQTDWPQLGQTAIAEVSITGDTTIPIDLETRKPTVGFTLNGAEPTDADAMQAGTRNPTVTMPFGDYGEVLGLLVWDWRTLEYNLPLQPIVLVGEHAFFGYASSSTANWPVSSPTTRRCFKVE